MCFKNSHFLWSIYIPPYDRLILTGHGTRRILSYKGSSWYKDLMNSSCCFCSLAKWSSWEPMSARNSGVTSIVLHIDSSCGAFCMARWNWPKSSRGSSVANGAYWKKQEKEMSGSTALKVCHKYKTERYE